LKEDKIRKRKRKRKRKKRRMKNKKRQRRRKKREGSLKMYQLYLEQDEVLLNEVEVATEEENTTHTSLLVIFKTS
jgi:hypothetical protein